MLGYWAKNTKLSIGHCGFIFQLWGLNFVIWPCYNHMLHNKLLDFQNSAYHIFFKGGAY